MKRVYAERLYPPWPLPKGLAAEASESEGGVRPAIFDPLLFHCNSKQLRMTKTMTTTRAEEGSGCNSGIWLEAVRFARKFSDNRRWTRLAGAKPNFRKRCRCGDVMTVVDRQREMKLGAADSQIWPEVTSWRPISAMRLVGGKVGEA